MDSVISLLGVPLGYVMGVCFELIKNYGLSILLFTLITKIILLPIGVWVHKNAIKMVRMQPDINFIKARFFGDADQIAEEQSKLYKKEKYNHLVLSPSDVIIVEGLHALNPAITDKLPADRLLKIYINVSSRIYDEKNNIILNKRNMRFIRRMVRDYKFRGNSVEKTFKLWLNVQTGEDLYLFPYRDNADIKINTIHLYETCVLKDMAIKLLSELSPDSEFYRQSQRLIKSLQKFPEIDSSLVPDTSLLREFIGPKEK